MGYIQYFYDLWHSASLHFWKSFNSVSKAFMKDKKVGYPNNNFSLSKLIKNNGLDRDKNKQYVERHMSK